MKVRILGSGTGPASAVTPAHQYVSSYVIDDRIAIDAGALGLYGCPDQQSDIRHIFLTHCHLDHIATLPVFLENSLEPGREPVTIYGHPASLEELQKHVFNDVIWPDFVRLSTPAQQFVKLHPIEAEVPFTVGQFTLTPVLVDHVVAAYGYIVTDNSSTVVFGGDSAPTDRLWDLARQTPTPRSAFLEASFPNAMHRLAEISHHLTPKLAGEEIAKMPEMKAIIAIHIKARFREDTVRELLELGISNLVIGAPDTEYEL